MIALLIFAAGTQVVKERSPFFPPLASCIDAVSGRYLEGPSRETKALPMLMLEAEGRRTRLR